MEFGKVNHPEKIDFSLPPASQASIQFLNSLTIAKRTDAHIFLGATGWSMPQWKGTVYPKQIKAKDFLSHYVKHFNCIEFNTTHYRIPSAEQVGKWVAGSSEDFKFCPKLPQTISHRNDLGLKSGQLDHFISTILGFGEHLGSCFMQLPPYFGPEQKGRLLAFLNAWPADEIELCIEFRQADWFKPKGREIFEDLRKLGIGSVITDVAGRRDVLHQEWTASYSMVRFVGNGMISSDLKRMSEWASLLADLRSNGLSHCYFFPHQPGNILGPQAAKYMGEAIQSQNLRTRFPNWSEPQEGAQISLF